MKASSLRRSFLVAASVLAACSVGANAFDGAIDSGDSALRREDTLTFEVRVLGSRHPVVGAAILIDGEFAGETDANGRLVVSILLPFAHFAVRAPGFEASSFEWRHEYAAQKSIVVRLQRNGEPFETVTRGQRDLSPLSTVVLTKRELSEVAGTHGDPMRAILTLPGSSAMLSGLGFPVVRGQQPTSTGYWIDGVELPSLYHLALGPSVVHPEALESLTYSPGFVPVLYGRHLGGAIEASLVSTQNTRVTLNADLVTSGAFASTKLGETSLMGAARYSYAGLVVTPIAASLSGGGDRPALGFFDYLGRIEHSFGGSGRLRFLAFGAGDEVGLDSTTSGVSVVARLGTHRADARYRRQLGLGELEVGGTWGRDTAALRFSDPQASFAAGTAATLLAGRASWRRQETECPSIAFGIMTEHRSGSHSFPVTSEDGLESFRSPGSGVVAFGAFSEATWRPMQTLLISGSIRADLYKPDGAPSRHSFDPRLAVEFRPLDRLSLGASVGAVHQTPSLLLHVPVVDIGAVAVGLQRAYKAEANATWQSRLWSVAISGHYAFLTHAVELDAVEVIQNLGSEGRVGLWRDTWGRAYGLEFSARRRFDIGLDVRAAYSLQRTTRFQRFVRFADDGSVVGESEAELPYPFDQTHVANAGLTWRLPHNLTMGAVVHFNTGRPESGQMASRTHREAESSDGEGIWLPVSRDSVARLPPYWRVDVRAAKQWLLNDSTLEAYVDILNASFSTEVLGFSYQPEVRETTGATARQKVPLPGFPIVVPMIGMKWTY